MDFIQLLAGTNCSPLPQNVWIGFDAQTGPSSLDTRFFSVEIKRLELEVTCSLPSSIGVKKEEAITWLYLFGFTTQTGTNTTLLRFMCFVKKTEQRLPCGNYDDTTSTSTESFVIIRSGFM
jgi:hypothetical protein